MVTRRHHEHDHRLHVLNTLLTTPHRKLENVYPIHQELIEKDPRFYVRLAAWYHEHGEVRDHKETFVITLSLSGFDGHRDVGLALLRQLPPYQVARVVDFIKGKKIRRHAPKSEQSEEITVEEVGLFRNVPRSMRTEVLRYLRERESAPERLDSVILHARKAMKRLYALLHVAPSPRAQAILFEENPPQDSLLHAVREISRSEDADAQARAIRAGNIPYRIASTIIREMSPAVLAALVDVMSPQELINNLQSLKERGAFKNEEIQKAIEQKLESAKTDKRVSAYKAKVAASASASTGKIADQLEKITEEQIKAKGRISRPTALLIDKSGSMHQSLEVGRQLGAMVSAICESDLFTYVYDTNARELHLEDTSLAGWEKALAGVYAGGGTSSASALEKLREQNQYVEQIVLVTDQGDNGALAFSDAYKAYRAEMNAEPSVIVLKIGHSCDKIERQCKKLGIETSAFDFRGDYYALPNVIPMLSQRSMMDLLMEIMEYPLPQRVTV